MWYPLRLIFLGVLLGAGLLPLALYADISRRELVSFSLDYYDIAEEKRQIEEVKKTSLQEAQMEKSQARQEKISQYLERFHPHISLETRFDDNIFRSHDKTSDVVGISTPGIKYETEVSQKKGYLLLDASAEIKQYTDHKEFDNQNPILQGLYTRGLGKYSFSVDGFVKKQQAAVSDLDDPAVDDKLFIDYWKYHGGFEFEADFKRLFEEIQYTYEDYRYDKAYGLTSNLEKHGLAFLNNLKVSPKTLLLVEYDHGWIDRTESQNDSQYNRYLAGFRGKLLDKVAGSFKAGYEERGFEEAEVKDEGTPYANVDLLYRATERLTYYLESERGFNVPLQTEEDVVTNTSVSLGCRYTPGTSKKLLLAARGSYTDAEYNSGRNNDIYNAEFRADFKFKPWLTLGAGYTFRNLLSNRDDAEYTNNISSVRLLAEF